MTERVPAEAFSPGDYIKEYLEERGWTQLDLAQVLGRNASVVNEIISGKTGVTPETAKGLAAAFGTSAGLWLNLDSAYRLWLSRNTGNPAVALRARIYAKAPVREMIRRRWIEGSENPIVLERQVLEFFQLGSLDDDLPSLAHAARKPDYEVTNPAQVAWLKRAEGLAPAAPVTGVFAPPKVQAVLRAVRELASHPQDVRRVPQVLAESGIRLLLVEPLPRTKIDGACFWLGDRSPVVVLSLRFDRIDWFWHTLMHELVHVSRGDGKSSVVVDVDMAAEGPDSLAASQVEAEVNRSAADMLISTVDLEGFIMRSAPGFPQQKIVGFAALHSIHPGIVVGQLQHRGELTFAQMRKFLLPIRSIVTQSALTDGWGSLLPSGL
ncbi:MAG TPA: HigA family addiction module antitoxin [Chloroflexota bacterium]|nr:HigA family addiction module antitoxin [Chloroflexota bacterium]